MDEFIFEGAGGNTPTPERTSPKRTRKRGKMGDINHFKRVLWDALAECQDLLDHDDPHIKLKSVSAMATAGGVYLKCLELSDLEARLTALEQKPERGAVN